MFCKYFLSVCSSFLAFYFLNVLLLCVLNHVRLFAALWTVACQETLNGILQARTGAGCHFLLQGIFQTQGSNLHFLCFLLLVDGFFTTLPPGKPHFPNGVFERVGSFKFWWSPNYHLFLHNLCFCVLYKKSLLHSNHKCFLQCHLLGVL